EQNRWHSLDRRAEEDGSARDARRWSPLQSLEERLERHGRPHEHLPHELTAAPPRRQEDVDRSADDQWNPTATSNLREVGAKESEIDYEKERRQRAGSPPRPMPTMTSDQIEEHARNGHRSGHRDSIRCAQGARRSEADDQKQTADHEGRVDLGHVDLPDLRP